MNDEINLEARKYDDLVIGDFVDTYENLPLKTFLGFQFFAGFCYGNKVQFQTQASLLKYY